MSQFSRELTEVKAAHARTARLLAQLEAADEKDRFLDKIGDEEAMTRDQQYADEAFGAWSRRAPHPRSREDRTTYRQRLCSAASAYLAPDHELRGVRLDDASSKVTGIFFEKFMSAMKAAARDVDTVPPGELRRIEQIAPTGHKVTTFVGRRTFIDDHHRPCRRVVGWGDGSLTGSHAGVLARANRELAAR
jgi:hypothetical protein